MRAIFDFKCRECGKVEEKLIDHEVRVIGCSCGGKMEKQVSMPMTVLDGTDPSLPGAWEKWANRMEKKARENAKKDRE